MKPYCRREKSGFAASPEGCSVEMPSHCRNVCIVPSSSFVPDFVITLTKPPAERPNSAVAPWLMTTISWIASWLKVNAGRWPPRCSPKNELLKSAPSTMKLLKMPRWPLMFNSSPSGPWESEAPGVSRVRSKKFRPFVGSPSITSSASRWEVVTSSVAGVP